MQSQAIFSVTQINEYIKMTLESNQVLRNVFLKGEISNFKSNYYSGHLYFSLKDENSSLRAVMFRSSASKLKFALESGMKVVAHGRISSYTVSGDCQIIIDDIQPDGAGSLAIAFEQLKKRLGAEGLFDAEKKKNLPKFPKTVGVVTSASGAALQDIINVSGRRSPSTEIIIYPSYVQGELAPKSLTGGILYFNNVHKVDIIIIGRGGGSAEDLWCFNDETLARAIAGSEIPVISAVGHETDFTICDFVADVRAPTPSAAAELAFPNVRDALLTIKSLGQKAEVNVNSRLSKYESRIDVLKKSIDLYSPMQILKDRMNVITVLKNRLDAAQNSIMSKTESDFRMLCARLEGVNPLAVLSHGYGVVEDDMGNLVDTVDSVNVGDNIIIKISDGELYTTVKEKRKKSDGGI